MANLFTIIKSGSLISPVGYWIYYEMEINILGFFMLYFGMNMFWKCISRYFASLLAEKIYCAGFRNVFFLHCETKRRWIWEWQFFFTETKLCWVWLWLFFFSFKLKLLGLWWLIFFIHCETKLYWLWEWLGFLHCETKVCWVWELYCFFFTVKLNCVGSGNDCLLFTVKLNCVGFGNCTVYPSLWN